MLRRFWLLVLLVCLLLPLRANAYIKLDFKGFIADEVNILPENIHNDLNMTLWDLQKKTGADIAVVVIDSLNGRSVEDVAIDIGKTYKVGSPEKNNGIVFLTAISDRKMRLELGLGLEDKISIASLDNIRDYDILPYYKKEDYVNGIARGTYNLAELVASVEGVEIQQQGECPPRINRTGNSANRKRKAPWWVYAIAVVASIFSPRRRRFNYGSFGGFGGGGGFGGSGSSGSW